MGRCQREESGSHINTKWKGTNRKLSEKDIKNVAVDLADTLNLKQTANSCHKIGLCKPLIRGDFSCAKSRSHLLYMNEASASLKTLTVLSIQLFFCSVLKSVFLIG